MVWRSRKLVLVALVVWQSLLAAPPTAAIDPSPPAVSATPSPTPSGTPPSLASASPSATASPEPTAANPSPEPTATAPPLAPTATVQPSAPSADAIDIPELRTVDSHTVRNDDGTFTTEYFSAPRYYDDGGEFLAPIDVAPVPATADGVAFRTKAAPVIAELGASSSGELLTVRAGEWAVSFRPVVSGLPGGASAADRAPVIDKGQVVYGDVYPGVDLRYTLLPFGAKEDIVLTEPVPLTRFAFAIDAPGLTPVLNRDGTIDLLDGKTSVFHVPAPFMVDSAPEADGDGARSKAVHYELATVAGASVMTVVADAAWLNDPARVYPVYLDPTTISTYGASLDTFISSAYPSTSLNAQWNPNEGGYYELWNGRYDASSGTNYAFVKTSIPSGVSVVSATFKAYVQHSYSLATPTSIYIGRLTSAFTESQTWNMTQPTFVALTSTNVADNQFASFNATSAVQAWVEGTATNHGFRIYEASTAQSLWKRLRARENATNPPSLSVTWAQPSATVVAPTGAAWIKTSALDWTFSNGGSSFTQTKFQAQVSTSSTTWSGTSLKADSGQVSSTATAWTAPTTNLVNGTTYYWRVRVFDGHSWSPYSSVASFKWDGTLPAANPTFVSANVGGAITAADPNYFDLGNGTFTIAIRGSDANSGIKLSYLRLYNATNELRVYHDWSSANTTNCNEFDTSTLADVTGCARTYNSGGTREVTFTVVGLNQSASFDIQYYFADYAGNTVGYLDTGKNLIFDAIAPTGAITAPATGATVNGSVTVTGTASDANFKEYQLHYGAGASPSSWTGIGTNPYTTQVTSGTLGTWDTASLANGTYTIRLRVYDNARVSSGFTEVKRTVEVQNAPPIAIISAPTAGTVLSGEATVSGTASAIQDFDQYTLHYGTGCSPSTWTVIGTGLSPVTNGVLGAWDTTSVSDGQYTIRLVTTKTTSETATATVCVSTDNSGPTADFTVPDEGTTTPQDSGTLGVSWTEDGGPSGVVSRTLQRQAGLVVEDGSCVGVSWVDDGTPTASASPLTVNDLESGHCYRWVLTLTDGNENTTEVTSGTVLTDIAWSGPVETAVTGTAIHQASNDTAYYGSNASSMTIEATATAPSGIASIWFRKVSMTSSWSPNPPMPNFDDEAPYVQQLDFSSGAISATLDVVAVNGVGSETSPLVVSLLRDTTAPSVTFDAFDARAATPGLTLSWSEADSGSGVAGRTLIRESAAPIEPGFCLDATWERDGWTSSAPSPVQPNGLADGACYRWLLTVSDNVGQSTTVVTPAVYIDESGPVVAWDSPSGDLLSGALGMSVAWSAEDDGAGVDTNELQRQAGAPVAGDCAAVTWTTDGAPIDEPSPATLGDLVPGTCYRWIAEAVDRLGNTTQSISPTVQTATVALRRPYADGLVFASEPLVAETSEGGLTRVDFLVDGVVIGSDSSAPYELEWDTIGLPDADHEVTAVGVVGGSSLPSTPISVTVANQLGAPARIATDAATGLISIDEEALQAAYAFGARAAADERYGSAPESSDGVDPLYFFRNWSLLDQATRDAIEAHFANPLIGYTPPPGVSFGDTDLAFPECDYEWPANGSDIVAYCLHESDYFLIHYLIPGARLDHSVPEVDVVDHTTNGCSIPDVIPETTCNGIPDAIDVVAKALDDSVDRYRALGFTWSAPAGDLRPVTIRDLEGGLDGKVWPFFPQTIELDYKAVDGISENGQPDFPWHLSRHEAFHRVQYEYIGFGHMYQSRLEDLVWMEATAEWAAHQAEYATDEPDRGRYAQQLADYLGRPHLRFSLAEALPDYPDPNDRQYGMFAVAEHLEQAYGVDSIRQTWVEMAAGEFFESAINGVGVGAGTTSQRCCRSSPSPRTS